jgi:ribosomal protein S18 acetylase RimI-like enzyme
MDLVPAGGDDGARLTSLLNEAYGPPEAFLYDGPRTTVEEVGERLARGTFLVLRAGDVLDGCVYLESEGARGYLGMLAVAPRRQGTGLGHALVKAGEAFLGERGVRRLEIEVLSARPELFGFYDRLGFVVTGRRPFECAGLRVPCDLVAMEKPLGAQDHQPPSRLTPIFSMQGRRAGMEGR